MNNVTLMSPTKYTVLNIGDHSPWGEIETVTYLMDGVTEVQTASHGGVHVDPQLLYRVPIRWRLSRVKPQASETCPWFEEDRDWVMVAKVFPAAFRVEERRTARDLFRDFVRLKTFKVAM